jgi:hypothetical protein
LVPCLVCPHPIHRVSSQLVGVVGETEIILSTLDQDRRDRTSTPREQVPHAAVERLDLQAVSTILRFQLLNDDAVVGVGAEEQFDTHVKEVVKVVDRMPPHSVFEFRVIGNLVVVIVSEVRFVVRSGAREQDSQLLSLRVVAVGSVAIGSVAVGRLEKSFAEGAKVS